MKANQKSRKAEKQENEIACGIIMPRALSEPLGVRIFAAFVILFLKTG